MADLSVREVADHARTSDRTVRRWLTEGKLAGTRTADGWTVNESDLTAFLDARTRTSDQVDGHAVTRPSEAPLLAGLLASTQHQLLQATAAAAMWQARAQHLQEQLERALPAPTSTESPLAGLSANAANGMTHTSSEARNGRPWWRLW